MSSSSPYIAQQLVSELGQRSKEALQNLAGAIAICSGRGSVETRCHHEGGELADLLSLKLSIFIEASRRYHQNCEVF